MTKMNVTFVIYSMCNHVCFRFSIFKGLVGGRWHKTCKWSIYTHLLVCLMALIYIFNQIHLTFQTFETQGPSAQWQYAFPQSKKNDNGKKHWLHVSASKYYVFHEILIQIADAKLDINITSEWKLNARRAVSLWSNVNVPCHTYRIDWIFANIALKEKNFPRILCCWVLWRKTVDNDLHINWQKLNLSKKKLKFWAKMLKSKLTYICNRFYFGIC